MSDLAMGRALEDVSVFWELYMAERVRQELPNGSVSDFLQWFEENYPEEYAMRFEGLDD